MKIARERVWLLTRTAVVLAVGLFGNVTYSPNATAISLIQPGYTATLVATLPADQYIDLELDGAGNIYVVNGGVNILKVTPSGPFSTWSTNSNTYDLTLSPAGDGYGTGGLCKCILGIQSNGAFAPLKPDTIRWINVALIPNGTLYGASSWFGATPTLYIIDRVSGDASAIVVGGPGPGGTGTYSALTAGSDGKLYVAGSIDGTVAGMRLFRLDGSQLSNVATLIHWGSAVAGGPSGQLFSVGAFDYGSGYTTGEIWIVDSATGSSSLLATSGVYPFNYRPTFDGIDYDMVNNILYVAEGHNLWAIKKDPTPARPESWGSVKALYRR